MPDVNIWIQLENRKWDCSPRNIDRITGQSIAALEGIGPFPGIVLNSPVTGASRTVTMFRPLRDGGGTPTDALIFRRYTDNWAAPEDRKVNPWDLNEPNPTDTGTMGTIPGPVIECNVGDRVFVHFRNLDNRAGKATLARTHSLHTHGFVFKNEHDGAYPLSPPDPAQPVGAESALWSMVGVTGNKRGDRVPPGATFTYTWNTFGWPTTAGVWLYHDHSVCDMDNVRLGAIGIVAIHNTVDPNDVIPAFPADFPGGSRTGAPTVTTCFPLATKIPILPLDLIPETPLPMPGPVPPGPMSMEVHAALPGKAAHGHGEAAAHEEAGGVMVQRGDFALGISKDLTNVLSLCTTRYRTPPAQAQYLQLFHELGDAGVLINGRKYLGNTPTMIGGPATKMRFGVVGMGDNFHTFHLHGHRWIIPGPDGTSAAVIQGSAQVTAVSQFEDTRIFGPANSFAFTVQEGAGSFMGARFTPDPNQASGLGEWHMHCHVLGHMMMGMMGSLLIVNGGEIAFALPRGQPCPPDTAPPGLVIVNIVDFSFNPLNTAITAGTTVRWVNNGTNHTVTSNPGGFGCTPSSAESFASPILATGATFEHTFNTPGSYAYHCEVHGCAMAGTIVVS